MFKLNRNIEISRAAKKRVLVDSFVHFERTHLYNDTVFVQSNPLDASGSDVYWCYEHPLINLAMEALSVCRKMDGGEVANVSRVAYVVVPDGLWEEYGGVGPYPEDASYFRKLGAVVREDVHRVLSEHPSARVTIACGGFELLGIAPWLPIETHDRLTVTCDDPLDVLKRTELLFTNKMSTLVVDALREGVPVRCFRE